MNTTTVERRPQAYMNPYLAGIGLGLVLLASFVLVGRGLGASGAFNSVIAWAVNAVAPGHAKSNEFIAGYLGDGTSSPLKSWLLFEVIGVFAGAMFSGLLAGRAKVMTEKGPARVGADAAGDGVRGRRADGLRRGACPRVHERPGADRRRATEPGQLGVHDDGVRRGVCRGVFRKVAMAMMAPFFKYGMFGDETSLVVAFLIGIGFGFFLERAGFGSARKLVSQFYLNDLAVFKVMFTAIVTAMLGVTYLGWIGWLDLSLVYLVPTYLVPQIVGGLILGVGFVVGGYCPGTSVAATATGRVDGLLYVLGIFAGMFAFAEMYPLLKGFYLSGAGVAMTLPAAFGLPYGVVVFAVVLMAVGGFYGAGLLEKKFATPVE